MTNDELIQTATRLTGAFRDRSLHQIRVAVLTADAAFGGPRAEQEKVERVAQLLLAAAAAGLVVGSGS